MRNDANNSGAKREFTFAWIDWLLLVAIIGLSVELATVLLEPSYRAWRNRPRPGRQVSQQYLVKPDKSVDTIPVNCLLYLPPEYSATRRWPLVIYLHGSGAQGHDLNLVRREGLPGLVERGKAFDLILLSPQYPRDSWWIPEIVVGLIDHISSSLSVDRDRVYLTGYSMGGNGTWATAIYDPDRFAAIAPLCGRGNVSEAKRLRNVPVWVFHGEKDQVIPLEDSRIMVDAMRKCGGNIKFSVHAGYGHDICDVTYRDEFFKWLLLQRRHPTSAAAKQ